MQFKSPKPNIFMAYYWPFKIVRIVTLGILILSQLDMKSVDYKFKILYEVAKIGPRHEASFTFQFCHL